MADEIDEAEEQIRSAFWAALSAWLVQVLRRVLRGARERPDPDALWALRPAWDAAVDGLISRVIMPLMQRAYAAITGEDLPWDQRPMLVRHLAEVRNRMARIPDEVYDLIAAQISEGVNMGEGIPQLAERVEQTLATTASERWHNRAVTVARTEAVGALNSARMDAFRQVAADEGGVFEKVWVSTIGDGRTRPTHVEADGQRVPLEAPFIVGGFPLMFPGDPSGPPQETIACVPGDTVVQFPGLRSAFRRWYEGEMISIEYATGDKLTITPNHPVLRGDGEWIPADLLNEGDHCIRGQIAGHGSDKPHPHHGPSEIGQVYGAARLVQAPNRIRTSPPDFHGDFSDGDVEVVAVHGELAFNGDPATDEQVGKLGLSLADLASFSPGGSGGSFFIPRISGVEADLLGSEALVRGASDGAPLIDTGPLKSQGVRFGSTSDLKFETLQASNDGVSRDPEMSGQTQDTFSLVVSLAQIVKIDRFAFSGHVFNLDTGHGWYTGNSIIMKNCRCSMVLVERGEAVDMSNRQFRG